MEYGTIISQILALLHLLPTIIYIEASLAARGGIGIGIGGGSVSSGGGVTIWIGGGTTHTPSTSSFSSPKLSMAYTVLQTWKSSITDDPLGITKSWVDPNVCSYRGIFCSDTRDLFGNPIEKTVAAIDLNHAYLQGTLVKELSYLTDLSLLHLNSNRFSGTIPSSLQELTSLTELDLSNNRFSGPFPTTVLRIPNLMYLDLRFNSFYGSIPYDLFDMRLDAIFLNDNLFDGEIPENLGNSPASVINLANNKLTGKIPSGFGYVGVREILFLNNQLTGRVPDEIGIYWSDLQVLDVSYNSLTGHLPDSLSCLNDIEVLNFGHNMLSGFLPDLVCGLTSLVNLNLADNFFSGFGEECGDRSNLGFDFSYNCVPGKDLQRPQRDCYVAPVMD